MNREILFRGKREDGTWAYGDLLQDADLEIALINGFNYYSSKNGLEREPFSELVVPETVGQYTGLTDKNGTKIFEGDIVHCVARLDEADCIVVYDDGEFRLVAEDRYKDYPTLGGFYAIRCFEKEVIGNIYEQGVQ